MSSLRPSRLKRPGTTADRVFERLIEAILSGEFARGTPLREARLARAWHVSRTPLREAVRRAAEAGFLVLRPNQAPLVCSLSGDDVADLDDLRQMLETHALELAWPNLGAAVLRDLEKRATAATPRQAPAWRKRCLEFDFALHQSWMRHCGNKWLADDLAWHYQFLRIFQSWIGRDDQALDKAYTDHLAILHAIKARDKTSALTHLRQHIHESAELVQQALRVHS